ncbi:ATP-binding cassette domain-containing protein [Aeromicrobium sp. UC242_57]|uniref:ATP-binding cassette domain-containing protein n=1 Tax=Aeromicrobium sp. UC242_57 TaxID=3374624 RepID=UPI00378D9F2B
MATDHRQRRDRPADRRHLPSARPGRPPAHCSRTSGWSAPSSSTPRQLSGGMRQRVSLLRTVVQGRPVMLLDEPFGALDAITRDELQQWLLEMWRRHGWTILLITHDIREAVLLSDVVHVFSPRPARILASVHVDRDIDRGADFGLDPRVPPLEAQLHAELTKGMAGA